MKSRRNYSAEFKAKVALDALKNEQTLSELSHKYDLCTSVIQKWKVEFLRKAPSVFSSNHKSEDEKLIGRLYQQIGRLQVDNEWLKKKL